MANTGSALDYWSYDPREGHGLLHNPIKAIVAPRPIGWISSIDHAGQVNLAPYSFFNMFNTAPTIVGFSSEGPKDSATNAEATGSFVVNIVGRAFAEQMNATSWAFSRGVSEMAALGIAALPSDVVAAPRVAGVPAALECRLTEVVQLKDSAGAGTGALLVLGEVVRVHIEMSCLVDGRFDTVGARLMSRAGYLGDYAETANITEMLRPKSDPSR